MKTKTVISRRSKTNLLEDLSGQSAAAKAVNLAANLTAREAEAAGKRAREAKVRFKNAKKAWKQARKAAKRAAKHADQALKKITALMKKSKLANKKKIGGIKPVERKNHSKSKPVEKGKNAGQSSSPRAIRSVARPLPETTDSPALPLSPSESSGA